jgi:hypothetical protein
MGQGMRTTVPVRARVCHYSKRGCVIRWSMERKAYPDVSGEEWAFVADHQAEGHDHFILDVYELQILKRQSNLM